MICFSIQCFDFFRFASLQSHVAVTCLQELCISPRRKQEALSYPADVFGHVAASLHLLSNSCALLFTALFVQVLPWSWGKHREALILLGVFPHSFLTLEFCSQISISHNVKHEDKKPLRKPKTTQTRKVNQGVKHIKLYVTQGYCFYVIFEKKKKKKKEKKISKSTSWNFFQIRSIFGPIS